MMNAHRRSSLAIAAVAAAVTCAVPTIGAFEHAAGTRPAAAGSQAAPAPAAAGDLQGKLYKSVFSSGVGALKYEDLPAAPEELRTRLARYLSRRAAFKSSYKSEADSFDAVRVEAKRRMIEQAIVALIEAPGIERMAADYVATAPIHYEWKGMHDGPLEEAAQAEALLSKNPSGPLAPWFYVFIAHRQRAAFEAYELAKNLDGMKAAAKKYRLFAERARAVPDPIFPALMADLDRQPFVHVKTPTHPRDYNPDA
jgi:hypothetical protein